MAGHDGKGDGTASIDGGVEAVPSLAESILAALPHAPNPVGHDLDFRPARYWDPSAPPVAAPVLSEHARLAAEAGFPVPPSELQARLESLDPSFMGGAYLPPLLGREVEIARASLDSTTADVISFRARPGEGGGIEYRASDEYEDEGSLYDLWPVSSQEPMTLGETILLVASARRVDESWPPVVDLGKSQDAPGFATISSAYYPTLGAFFREEDLRWQMGLQREWEGGEVEDGE